MANPKQEELLKKGAKAWNDSFVELARDTSPDLSEARLSECNLTGAFLREADLKNADLRYATLEAGTVLWKADLSGAKLDCTKLTGANLNEVKFAGAHFLSTNLREADLKGADLGQFQGSLLSEHLAGSDLTGATLPEPLTKYFERLDAVKEISESARKLFVAMLAGCFYSWLTVATTTDVNLITNRNSTALPIIQTTIPIVSFYVVAPVLVLCVYFYFHFYLQKLWEELGSLPAVFPDGRPLHAKVDPWLLNDLVRAHLPKLRVNRPFLSFFQLWISVLLAWWVVPITMLLFWGRYLRRHNLFWTTFHVVLLVISVLAAVHLYNLSKATLRGAERKPFTWKGMFTSRRSYQRTAFACGVGVVLGLVSFGGIRGVRSSAPILGFTPRSEMPFPSDEWLYPSPTSPKGPHTWVPRCMALVGYPPFANLDTSEISQKKPTWSERDKDLDSVIRAQLFGVNLRYASASHSFLAGADLQDADLSGVNLSYADLKGADLSRAHLNGADLFLADMSGANLNKADLSVANMSGAHLNGANLSESRLNGAYLISSDLKNANLSAADLSRADLRGANLTYSFIDAWNLSPQQVMNADWKKAFIDQSSFFRNPALDKLYDHGFTPDHNEKLAQEYAKENPDRIAQLPWIQNYLPKQ